MLTFEKIRELDRLEHDSKDLVKLPENFISDLNDYLARKRESADEREFKNIENTLKRFFERRERKLLELVNYAARTDMPVDNIATHEKDTFDQLLSIFRNYRNSTLSILEVKKVEKEGKTEKVIAHVEYYRVKRTLKSFVGPDSKIYTLKENDTFEKDSIPKALKDLLIKESIIEKVVEEK